MSESQPSQEAVDKAFMQIATENDQPDLHQHLSMHLHITGDIDHRSILDQYCRQPLSQIVDQPDSVQTEHQVLVSREFFDAQLVHLLLYGEPYKPLTSRSLQERSEQFLITGTPSGEVRMNADDLETLDGFVDEALTTMAQRRFSPLLLQCDPALTHEELPASQAVRFIPQFGQLRRALQHMQQILREINLPLQKLRADGYETSMFIRYDFHSHLMHNVLNLEM